MTPFPKARARARVAAPASPGPDDEPFTGLDDAATEACAGAHPGHSAKSGAIVVLATHDLDLADGIVTRVAIVRSGKLVTDEPRAPDCARATGRWWGTDMRPGFLTVAMLVLKKEPRHRAKSREIVYTDAVLRRRVRDDLLVCVRQGRGRAGGGRPRPASLWMRRVLEKSGTPWRSVRTFERERYSETFARVTAGAGVTRRRCMPGNSSEVILMMVATEVILTPMVALSFSHAPFFARPLLLAALLGLGTIGSPPSERCSLRCSCARGHAMCCCPSCCMPVTMSGHHSGRSRHGGASGSRAPEDRIARVAT